MPKCPEQVTVNENILKNWVPPPPNVKLFTWLATRGTLWTEDRRRRHNLDAHDVCWMCDQEQETRDHILVNCSYTIWWGALLWLGRACSFPPQPCSLHCRTGGAIWGNYNNQESWDGAPHTFYVDHFGACGMSAMLASSMVATLWCRASGRR